MAATRKFIISILRQYTFKWGSETSKDRQIEGGKKVMTFYFVFLKIFMNIIFRTLLSTCFEYFHINSTYVVIEIRDQSKCTLKTVEFSEFLVNISPI